MRMRRKKHLDDRLAEFRNLIDTPQVRQDYRLELLERDELDLPALFGNKNPLHLEIGCGKGQFACRMAALHPELNFLAVEVNRNVLVDACRTAESMELSNLLFLRCGAEVLPKYLPDSCTERIYLNFSCPFPKNAYANRRLTNHRFMPIYDALLQNGGEIHQKTDNMHFFEYSIEQFTAGGFRIKNVSLDLHNSGFSENVETEYEQKFSSMGMPIYRLEAYR